jgi:glycosyltransferase involved in cell wall biosynthesis
VPMADVGIVIPSHNSARFLAQTIKSIREQTFANWKCVIVDDCSSDDSREIAKSFCDGDARFSLLPLEENRGTSAARNAGLAGLHDSVYGGVRYVVFLDSDDVWNVSSLQALVDAIERHPSWVAVHGNCRLVDRDGTHVRGSDAETASRETFDYHEGRLVRLVGAVETTFCQLLLRNPIVSPGCLLIRADVIERITNKKCTLFDAGMKYVEDLDAWFRIRRVGFIGHLDEIVLDYRRHGSNKSNRHWTMAISMRKVRLRALWDTALGDREFHEACKAFGAYRIDRIRRELGSAASCLRSGQIRAGTILFGCSAFNVFDILTILMIRLARRARKWGLDSGWGVLSDEFVPDTDDPERYYDALDS